MAGPRSLQQESPNYQSDAFSTQAGAGDPLGGYLIDVHSHPGVGNNMHWAGGDVDDMVRTMDRTGVDVACFSAYVGIGPDFIRGNDLVAEAISQHPTRVVGFAVPNPHYLSLYLQDLPRRVEEQGFRGIKIHPSVHQYPVGGPNYEPVYQFADEHSLPVLSHTWESPATLAMLARTYPKATFIWAHGIWWHVRMPDLAPTVRDLPNAMVDTAGSFNRRGQIEDFVRSAGAEHVVFGSDFPVISQTWALGQIAHAQVSVGDKRRIFGENMRPLLNL